MSLSIPFRSVRAPGGMVASADHLATTAGLHVLSLGGNAVDAAIATNAAIAVTGPHLCGMGGDLFALVHWETGAPDALDSAGRAGSGATAEALRAEGMTAMPFRHRTETVTVPGCVDGWIALHERFASLPLDVLLAPAIRLAEEGFPASPLLVGSLATIDATARLALHELAEQATRPGVRVRRPGVAGALRAIAAGGRDAFYLGPFGEGLSALSDGRVHTTVDLARRQSTWVEPATLSAWGHELWTMPPPSQGYLTLAGSWIAEYLGVPDDPDDPRGVHLHVEAAIVAGADRPARLHAGASATELLDVRRLSALAAGVDPDRAGAWPRRPYIEGDTTYLCVVDAEGRGVSLIQSNAAGFGSWLVEPTTGINLHNRGLGFSLEPGHPAELRPGSQPPHTLSPALVTRPGGDLAAVLGTMGGDAQPQILQQLIARLFRHGLAPAAAVGAGRWVLHGPDSGFDTWTTTSGPVVLVEGHAPEDWASDLAARGHRVERVPSLDSTFGHAHAIVVEPGGMLAGAADPRAVVGSAAGR